MEIELYKETFEQEVLQSDIPVLVDFWATWCGPCKMIAPIVKEIADEYDGKILVGKVNVDEEPDLTMQYNVSSIPTLMVFKNGQLVNKAVGYREKDEILKMLKSIYRLKHKTLCTEKVHTVFLLSDLEKTVFLRGAGGYL